MWPDLYLDETKIIFQILNLINFTGKWRATQAEAQGAS